MKKHSRTKKIKSMIFFLFCVIILPLCIGFLFMSPKKGTMIMETMYTIGTMVVVTIFLGWMVYERT